MKLIVCFLNCLVPFPPLHFLFISAPLHEKHPCTHEKIDRCVVPIYNDQYRFFVQPVFCSLSIACFQSTLANSHDKFKPITFAVDRSVMLNRLFSQTDDLVTKLAESIFQNVVARAGRTTCCITTHHVIGPLCAGIHLVQSFSSAMTNPSFLIFTK